ncbi:MAG: M48 family metalloprotease [Candidatus Solibacter sp.]|jgi:predicted Zn-dependent protease
MHLLFAGDFSAELAGVTAHEISHVAARHSTRQATRGEIANYASLPLIFMGGWAGYAIQSAASVIVPIGFLKFSRGFEAEADQLGLQYLYKTGYDPNAFIDFFEKSETLEKTKPGTLSRVFSTHPMTEDRIKAAQLNIQQNLKIRAEYILNTSEFVDVKARLDRLENRRKPLESDSGRPTLRRRAGTGATVDGDTEDKTPKTDQDERPTLKRRN